MARKIYNIVTKTIFVFVILIVALLLYYAGKRLITKDKTASIFGYSFYHVSTNSMVPVINGGDFIIVKERKEYRVGMDITYQLDKNSTPITHRIVEINGNTVITEGVNNNGDEDDPLMYLVLLERLSSCGEIIMILLILYHHQRELF
jgi:signal peptidase I